MRNVHITLSVLATMLPACASAQDVLEACRAGADPYEAGVNKIIDSVVAPSFRLQLTTLPSFEPESGLRLVGSRIYLLKSEAALGQLLQTMERE
jgi:hypothetical protein